MLESGEHNIICVKIGSNKLLLLDHTYHINTNIFHNYTIHEHIINNSILELSILTNTNKEHDLQSVYNGNGFICTIAELSQVYLAIYDIPIEPITYTSSENIDITNNQISLPFSIKVNDEIVLNPRSGGVYFEIYAGTSGIPFLQNQQDGAQPIAIFNSLDQSCELFGDVDIPFLLRP